MALPDWMIVNYVKELMDKSVQLQPAGVDLSVRQLYRFISPGEIGFRKKSIAEVEAIQPQENVWILSQGAYKVMFNEVVEVPKDAVALCFPRSSLLRSGALIMHRLGSGLLWEG